MAEQSDKVTVLSWVQM